MSTANGIIPQTPPNSQPSRSDICLYCGAPAQPHTAPPMCDRHLDLDLLVEHLQDHGREVTVENATQVYRQAVANGGGWDIGENDLAELLPAFLERQEAGS